MARVAIVTGGTRGIGEAISIALKDAGMKVAANYAGNDERAREFTERTGIPAYKWDVADHEACIEGVKRVEAEIGPIDVLVNNAGITRDNLLFKMTEQDWDAVMDVHLKGAFLMTKACQVHMTEQRYGRVVNLSSSSAQGNRGQANYSAAKAGLQGFTKTLAIELGKFGVTANAVAPGFIQTDMTRATAERLKVSFEDFITHTASQIPVARVGQPEDIAATIAFLVSEEAGFVSGQVIYVAGGPLD